jgi:hypothetical protein
MSFPTVIFGPPDSMPYEIYTGVAAAARKSRLPLGTQLVTQDGRKFRFVMNGGALLVVGNVINSAIGIATDEDLTPAAGAVGDRLITFTHGAATTIANYFSEGIAVISVTPGGGDTYKISQHDALRNATAGDVVNLDAGHALRRALTTTSRVDLCANPYAFVIQAPVTTITSPPVGVAVSAITATTGAGWVQTAGVCGVLTSGTVIIGNRVVNPAGAAGAIAPETGVIGNVKIEVPVGTVLKVAATTAWSTIMLNIDS